MREKIVAGNWKMNKNIDEAMELVVDLQSHSTEGPSNVKLIIAPPALYLAPIEMMDNLCFDLSAQNCSHHDFGAFTGEVSEMLEERKGNHHFVTILHQLQNGLFHLSAQEMKKVVIAYEPVWAIGTGVTASTEQAQEMHKFIRESLHSHFGEEVADLIPILYGGSVNASNSAELFACADVDGGLVGGASLKARDFISIIKSAQ